MSFFYKKHSSESKNAPIIISAATADTNFTNCNNITNEPSGQVNQSAEGNGISVPNNSAKNYLPIRASKTANHVRSFPLVKQTRSCIESCSMTRIVYGNIKTSSLRVIDSKPVQYASPLTLFLDDVVNSGLTFTESFVPSIKTKTYQRIEEELLFPFVTVKNFTSNISKKTVGYMKNGIYKPAHQKLLNYRLLYNQKIIKRDDNKPLVRGIIDPIVIPMNKLLENFTNNILPKGEKVPTEGFCCATSRMLSLGINLVTRGTSESGKKAKYIASQPFIYCVHINDVCNKELDKEEIITIKGTYDAIIRASSNLETEAVTKLKSTATAKIFLRKTDTSAPQIETFTFEITEPEPQIIEGAPVEESNQEFEPCILPEQDNTKVDVVENAIPEEPASMIVEENTLLVAM